MENSEALYREQIEQLKDYALFFTDVNGVITTWNAGVEYLFGYSEGEWIKQHASLIFTPADQAVTLWEAEMRIAREQGTASDIRWHRKKDGTEFFANGVLNAVFDSAGNLRGFTKIISDETARKQLEDSLWLRTRHSSTSLMRPAMTCRSLFGASEFMRSFFSENNATS